MKLLFLILLFVVGYFFWSTQAVAGLEQPKYEEILREGRFEVRKYAPLHIAQTTVQGDFSQSLRTGFRRIANYIFGGNAQNQSIAMTAPVVSTMPNSGAIDIFFVLPSAYDLQTLPKPNSSDVILQKENWQEVAIYRFGGWATEERVQLMQKKLQEILDQKGFQVIGTWRVAQYNPPYTPPPFRHNELMVQIQR